MTKNISSAILRIQQLSPHDESEDVLRSIYQEFIESSIEEQLELGQGLINFAGQESPLVRAFGLRWLGLAYSRKSEIRKALLYYYQSVDLYTSNQAFSNVLACQMEIGETYIGLGDFTEALEIFEESLELASRINNDGGRLASLIYLSQTHRHLKNWTVAMDHAKQAIALARNMGRTRAEGGALLALANVMLEKKAEEVQPEDHLEAKIHLDLALTYFVRANDQALLSEAYILESKIMCGLEEFMNAEQSIQKAVKHAERYGSLEALGECELQFGRVYGLQRQFEAALSHLEQAKKHFDFNTIKKNLAETHKEFYKVYRARSEFQLALEHFELFYKFESLVRSERAERQSQALTVKIERENIRRETLLYQQRSEELSQLNAQLDRQASEDSLTGLGNRRMLEGFMNRVFAEARANRTKLSVVLLDIDHFKTVNDRFLHASGDQVLIRIAKILRDHCREHDLVVRYGGEEFALVLPGVGGHAIYRLCERIRTMIAKENMTDIHPDLRVTISLGWCDDTSFDHQEKMFSAADRALYASKNAGRNQTQPKLAIN